MFSPHTELSRQLQSMLTLDRAPSCSSDHGRLEILLRGSGMTDQSLESRVTLAQKLTDTARPLLRDKDKREHRRFAERAIAVVFEDEQVAGNGIATSRFTYVASVEHDAG
jgi:hypothetical protein